MIVFDLYTKLLFEIMLILLLVLISMHLPEQKETEYYWQVTDTENGYEIERLPK